MNSCPEYESGFPATWTAFKSRSMERNAHPVFFHFVPRSKRFLHSSRMHSMPAKEISLFCCKLVPTMNRTLFVIRDEGIGMTPEIMERVSEPFFTTKPQVRAWALEPSWPTCLRSGSEGSCPLSHNRDEGAQLFWNCRTQAMSNPKEVLSDHRVVLVVDDDDVFRRRLCRALQERGWDAHDAGNAEETLNLAGKISPDLVLLDLKMPDTSGLDLIEKIKDLDSTIAIIMLTGYGSIATAMQALKLGADHYLSKPVDAEQILIAYNDLNAPSSEQNVPGNGAQPCQSRVGAHPARSLRLFGQHHSGREAPRNPSPLTATKTVEISAHALMDVPACRSCRPATIHHIVKPIDAT